MLQDLLRLELRRVAVSAISSELDAESARNLALGVGTIPALQRAWRGITTI
jgi:hypothetical protein